MAVVGDPGGDVNRYASAQKVSRTRVPCSRLRNPRGIYARAMTAAQSFELPPHSGAPAEAVDAAADGQVVYLMRDGQPIAAVVPTDVATAGAAAVEALEEAEDIQAARAALADRTSRVPLSEVLAEYADDLAAYPDVDAQ